MTTYIVAFNAENKIRHCFKNSKGFMILKVMSVTSNSKQTELKKKNSQKLFFF